MQDPSNCKKWSSTCGDSPSHHRTALNFPTVVSPSSSVSSYEQHYNLHPPSYQQPWLISGAHEANHHTWKARRGGGQVHLVVDDDEDVKLVSAIKVKSHDSSASNDGSVEQVQQRHRSRFKELSAENLKVLCSALEKEVPWQAEIMPEIASTVLQCRSGMARTSSRAARAKEDTWLLFLGGDAEGKARVARELARLVFGSCRSFVSIGSRDTASSSPARSSDSAGRHRHKRPRLSPETSNGGGIERLYEAVRDNPHRVILVEDVEKPGQRGILQAIESGLVRIHGGDEAALGDAIVVLSCESFDARSRTSSPPTAKKAKTESEEEEEPREEDSAATSASPSSSCFDLNMRVENDDMEESRSMDASLLKAVDRAFFFRRPDESSD